jgi:hypothetical protein
MAGDMDEGIHPSAQPGFVDHHFVQSIEIVRDMEFTKFGSALIVRETALSRMRN